MTKFGLGMLLFCALFSVRAEPSLCIPTHFDQTVQLSHVIDGETLALTDGRIVRLIGIKAPTIDTQYPELSEPFANQSRQFLAQQLSDKQTLYLAFDNKRLDSKGKTLAYVYTEQKLHLQEMMLSQGYAKARVYLNDYFWQCLDRVEQSAREAKLGLWRYLEYQTKTVEQLSRDDLNHWIEIRGVVTNLERKDQNWSLIVDEKLHITVPSELSPSFTQVLTINLLKTSIIIKGELYFSYGKWQIITHHPSQIILLNEP
ncbi:thermonuclease family protein [Shewanella sp. AS1]|uniref:thermonuclease family protein n=1 Tax=Shewanella sp. AS1 TaxID=2907626 RepID=UPI001F43DA84|nr:thermonuclease family protein [Shewanella sp. AS1]MCE9679775.1 thermonuclease family protein [Shewanella sp. AS1]